jgi:hypothetical protein
MCGIVGVISKVSGGLYYTDLDIFQNLLVCDSLRGEDSTGVFGVYKNRQARTLKVAAEPHMMFRCPEWDDFRTKAISGMQVVVGHNRSATRGAVNTANAHPFNEGRIILVHNGTLHNQKDFNKDVEVDSHAITHALNERPAKDVLKEIDGAFAFVWYNREDGKTHIARNHERPLSFVETTSNIYFASEAPMLDFVLGRRAGTYDKAQPFPVGKIISYDSRGNKEEEDFDLYVRPKPTGVVTYYPKTPVLTGKTTTTGSNIIKNERVLLKITTVEPSLSYNGHVRVRGKLISGDPDIDCTGICSHELGLAEAMELLKAPYAQGFISGEHTTTCGKSYYVHSVTPAEYIDVYNKRITIVEWNDICDNHTCDKCGAHIAKHQTTLTSVKQRKSGKYRIVCSDCVTEALDEKTHPNIEDCNTEIQSGQPVSKVPSSWPFPQATAASIMH